MDIIIKSFNRPYYLDRCLYSIKNHIRGYSDIFVLDDGTPQKYLSKIHEKHPNVKILKSDLYTIKSNSIVNLETYKIPIDFWVKSAKTASDYFLLLEDDFWVIEDLNLDKFNLNEKEVVFTKLLWLGNPKLKTNRIKERLEKFEIVFPKLITKKPIFFKLIFKTYGFGFNKIMRFLKLNSLENILPYYNIYSVSGVIFKKNYFINLWLNHENKIDESLQILNALKYLNKYKKSKVACSKKEYFKIGFKSSATFGINNKSSKNNSDLLRVNVLLNESWLNDEFDTIKNLPNDINEEDIIRILYNSKKEDDLVMQWKEWVEKFKQQYQEFGCKID